VRLFEVLFALINIQLLILEMPAETYVGFHTKCPLRLSSGFHRNWMCKNWYWNSNIQNFKHRNWRFSNYFTHTDALSTATRPGTHCLGGWVGPRAGLDRCELEISFLHGCSKSAPYSAQQLAAPTKLSQPPVSNRFFNYMILKNSIKRSSETRTWETDTNKVNKRQKCQL